MVAFVAVLAMHGITSAHGAHLADGFTWPSSTTATMSSGVHDAPAHGAEHQLPDGTEVAALGCAFAVLVGARARFSGFAPTSAVRVIQTRSASQHSAPPDPPVPRFASV